MKQKENNKKKRKGKRERKRLTRRLLSALSHISRQERNRSKA